MNIILYRTPTCPKCKVLEMKLHQKGLSFTECTDLNTMIQLGITEVPQLQVDGGELMNLSTANQWIKSQEATHG